MSQQRDVKKIDEVLSTLTVGTLIRAEFSKVPYGNFAIEGAVGKAFDGTTWQIGGYFLDDGKTASKYLVSLMLLKDVVAAGDDWLGVVEEPAPEKAPEFDLSTLAGVRRRSITPHVEGDNKD